MNKMNRKLEYALMALKYMSQKIPGELTTAKEVSESFHTPFDATARVMQQLTQKGGILRAEYGVNGGYQINKDLARISIFELIEVVDGPSALAKCLHREGPCDIQDKCNIVSPVTLLNQRLNDFYKNLSLKELLIEQSFSNNKKMSGAPAHG